ncbi:flagella basal body P-ring formation protein FlgA [Sulfurihydrogenibium subterraneum]|uniref:flagella basal body P-ring formation protein FlgA n=1 Tax=Sulfurihydrogenibium subterraneum TaxID=171121 RepID=UPI00049041D6|nr:flagella basal body P-ring formation protein FlgA [Sulfurihydrogenibium subterraneum]
MVWFFILILAFIKLSFSADNVEKFKNLVDNYVKTNFKEFEIVNMVKIPESYTKQITEDFDSVDCKSKGNSGLYLYLSCLVIEDGKTLAEIPVAYRISQQKDGKLILVIRKNQKVNILYMKGAIKVQLLGIALDNGKEGDYIKVKNISTGKEIVGKVIDGQTVLVEGE